MLPNSWRLSDFPRYRFDQHATPLSPWFRSAPANIHPTQKRRDLSYHPLQYCSGAAARSQSPCCILLDFVASITQVEQLVRFSSPFQHTDPSFPRVVAIDIHSQDSLIVSLPNSAAWNGSNTLCIASNASLHHAGRRYHLVNNTLHRTSAEESNRVLVMNDWSYWGITYKSRSMFPDAHPAAPGGG